MNIEEVKVSKQQITRKSRANGSDIYTTLEVGKEDAYGGIKPYFLVRAHGNFGQRTPAKALDPVWAVYEIAYVVGKTFHTKYRGEMTKQEAIQQAKVCMLLRFP